MAAVNTILIRRLIKVNKEVVVIRIKIIKRVDNVTFANTCFTLYSLQGAAMVCAIMFSTFLTSSLHKM